MSQGHTSSRVSPLHAQRGQLRTLFAAFLVALAVMTQVVTIHAQGRSCQTEADCGSSQLDPLVCTPDTRLCVPGDCVFNSECSSADPTKFCNVDVGECTARRGEGGLCVDAFGLSDEAICMPGLSCTAGTCRARGAGSSVLSSTTPPATANRSTTSSPPSRTPDPSPKVPRTASSPPSAVTRSPASTTKSEAIGGTRISAQDASSTGGSNASSSSFSLLGLVIGLGVAALGILLAITILQTRRSRNKKRREEEAFLRRVVANNMGRRPSPTSTDARSNSAGSQSTPTRSPASTTERPVAAAPSVPGASAHLLPAGMHTSEPEAPYPSTWNQGYPAEPPYPQPHLYPAQPAQYGHGAPPALVPAPMPQASQVYFAESSFGDSHSHAPRQIPHGQHHQHHHQHHGSQLPPPPPNHLERPSPSHAQHPRPRRGSRS